MSLYIKSSLEVPENSMKLLCFLLTTNVTEGKSCKLKIYWYFKPHLGQSIKREKRINQWELESEIVFSFSIK